MKDKNGAYYGFEKNVDVDESSYYNILETEAYMHDQYVGAEL